jgi:Fe-S cluster assembly iron-binding protein IscA
LLENLSKRNKSAVRLSIKGFGWGGPTFGVVLDEQTSEDDVQEVAGIKFVAEKDISFLFDGAKVIYRKGVFGDFFDVYTPNSSGGC